MQEFLASTNFTVIFISLIGIKFLLETYLKLRNLKSIELNKNAIPERFVGVVTEEEYKKSIVYNIDRIRFQIFTALFGAVVLSFLALMTWAYAYAVIYFAYSALEQRVQSSPVGLHRQ